VGPRALLDAVVKRKIPNKSGDKISLSFVTFLSLPIRFTLNAEYFFINPDPCDFCFVQLRVDAEGTFL
jgi:hypothetical protein